MAIDMDEPKGSGRLPAHSFSAEDEQKALAAALAAARAWQLTTQQQEALLGLNHCSGDASRGGSAGPSLSREVLERVLCVLTIDAALHVLLPVPERANTWVHRPNKAALFNGEPALSRMLTGRLDDLKAVAFYLQSVMSGDFS